MSSANRQYCMADKPSPVGFSILKVVAVVVLVDRFLADVLRMYSAERKGRHIRRGGWVQFIMKCSQLSFFGGVQVFTRYAVADP